MTTVPTAAELTAPIDGWLARLEDPSPVFPAIERLIQERLRQDFASGRGPDGPHRGLKASTLRSHRTGVPLWNTKDLGRSYYDPGHPHYHFEPDGAGGFEHRSSHPVIPYLTAKGYAIIGFEEDLWAEIDRIYNHYLDTGEMLHG